MAKFSIMLFGIDSYTKNKMQLPYKLDAKSSDAALREARMCAMTFYRVCTERGADTRENQNQCSADDRGQFECRTDHCPGEPATADIQ